MNALTFALTSGQAASYAFSRREDGEALTAAICASRGQLGYCVVRRAHNAPDYYEVACGEFVTPPLNFAEMLTYILRKFW